MAAPEVMEAPVAAAEPEREEFTLEAFQDLILQLTGQRVPSLTDRVLQVAEPPRS